MNLHCFYSLRKQIHVAYTLPIQKLFYYLGNKENLPNNKSIITSINFNILHQKYKITQGTELTEAQY